MNDLTYILPIRRTASGADGELTQYLRRIGMRAELIIVDGSSPAIYREHAAAWSAFGIHIPVDLDVTGVNGKVNGVLTGLRRASYEAIVIADDDVRYDDDALEQAVRSLDHAHVVRPQNYFEPLPWHARWDTGRILLNRAAGGDWPGTLIVRRSALRATGGYANDVLFENLELVRTVVAAGGVATVARALFARRIPPDAAHFRGQRVRQAYDEFARPRRLLLQLAIIPAAGAALWTRHVSLLAAAALLIIAVAEFARARDGGRRVFPVSGALFSPLWVMERGACSWLALASRMFRGGVPYAGGIVSRAATPMRALRRRYAGAITSTSIGLNVPLFESSAEQAVTPTMRSISARNDT